MLARNWQTLHMCRALQVFMELQRTSEGKLLPLENKNIDTGLGLERVAQILQVGDATMRV